MIYIAEVVGIGSERVCDENAKVFCPSFLLFLLVSEHDVSAALSGTRIQVQLVH